MRLYERARTSVRLLDEMTLNIVSQLEVERGAAHEAGCRDQVIGLHGQNERVARGRRAREEERGMLGVHGGEQMAEYVLVGGSRNV